MGLTCKLSERFGSYYSFIKFWGQTINFGKYFTVAVTVASGLPDTDNRQAGYGAECFQIESGLPDIVNGILDIDQ